MSSILIFAEQRNGKLKKAAAEAISRGRELASQLGLKAHVLLIGGPGTDSLAPEASKYGVASILTVSHADLGSYVNKAYAKAISQVAREQSASVVLMSATAMGKELGAFVAVYLQASFVTDCTDLVVSGSTLKAVRPVFTGKAMSTVSLNRPVAVLTLRPNAFPASELPVSASVTPVQVTFSAGDFSCKVTDVIQSGGKLDVAEADIVVSGGRSLGSAENFKILEELAAVLGGAVGASRAAVDSGYRPHEDQVGQTGKVISPKLYIACGISGAIQHLAGMSSSKVIVAVNKDKDAPIFQVADYGIVADLFEVVPALTKELKNRLS